MSQLHGRHYTLQEALGILAAFRSLVAELVESKGKLDQRGFDVYRHQYFGGTGPNGDRFFPPELERMVEILKNLAEKEIIVKDLDSGLIDFPHFRSNGEEVYLCWKLGEPTIGYWHRIADGFAGRKPISDL
jgi:hypothetical protein